MAKFRRLIAVLSLILAVGFALHGQSAAQEGACSSENFLVAFSADAQYETACAAFIACMEWVEDFEPCTPHFYAARAEQCLVDDEICVAQVRLHTALIGLTVGNGYVDHGQPDEYWVELAANIGNRQVFGAADFQTAMEWFGPLYDAYSGEHPMWFYSNGVIQLLKRDPVSGFQLIEGSITLNTENPLAYLTRGDLYAAQGEDEMAALDYFMAAALTGAPGLNEKLETMLTSRTSAYPFGYDAAVYALYPVLQTHEGPGGRSIIDMALEEPIEIYLQRHGDLLLFIPADFEHEREENPYRILLPFYAMAEGIDERYIWIGEDYYAGYSSQLSLMRTDSGFEGQRKDSMFEANSALEFALVPEGSGDPRPAGFRCEGAPATRLEGAVFATPLRWWEPVRLYDEPDGTATEIEQDSQMLIALIGEPECLGGFTWWPVKVIIESEEQTGWIQENMDSTQYFYDRIDYD